jgi:signal transduction histidine kinase
MPKVRVGTSRSTYGLLGMSERITLLGGTLQIESAPGSGTRIEASIPTKTNKRLGHD